MRMQATALAMLACAGCLDPLTDDATITSTHVLKPDAKVPSVADDPELTSQVQGNDGLPDTTTVVPLQTGGLANGKAVKYWAFGAMTTAPSPIYIFLGADGKPNKHPPLVDALPGDPAYSAIHTLVTVQTTAKYHGELITTSQALADAFEIGLIEKPVPDPKGRHVASPIVLPNVKIEVGAGDPVPAETVYGHGVAAGMFRFGGDAGLQPGGFVQLTMRVSFLREQGSDGSYDKARPIFQAFAPPEGLPDAFSYTPLSVEVDVDLLSGHPVTGVDNDDQLFVSVDNTNPANPPSNIKSASDIVATYNATPNVLFFQQQFQDGAL